MQRRMTKFWVVSIDTCSIPGCSERCVALDIMAADGRRCEKHIPPVWIEELDQNAYEMFERKEPSKIKSFNQPVDEKPVFLQQSEIDTILDSLNTNVHRRDSSELPTIPSMPKMRA